MSQPRILDVTYPTCDACGHQFEVVSYVDGTMTADRVEADYVDAEVAEFVGAHGVRECESALVVATPAPVVAARAA